MSAPSWKISAASSDLREGLFGQIVLWTFELLPYLQKKSIYPSWDIKSKFYGTAPEYTVIPGIFDLAYTPTDKAARNVDFLTLRNNHTCVLGTDWTYLHRLWHSYFKIPNRITLNADSIELSATTLGIHYRGTDKNQSVWDTNAVSQADFITLIKDFLRSHQDIDTIFLATDEFSFVANVTKQLSSLKIITLGEVGFHKNSINIPDKADRALLDCLLLSRCKYLLKCSSALSAFTKILNPKIEAYRVSASKLFSDIPYFPEAYLPKLTSTDPECIEILDRQFVNDWRDNRYANWRFGKPFRTQSRYIPLVKFKKWIEGTDVGWSGIIP
jgi:hypothetical protein